MKSALILVTAAVLTLAHAEAGDMKGDTRKGRELAQTECSQCHRVTRAAVPPGILYTGPAFSDVANSARITPTSLFVFLRSSHPPMPNIALSQQETADLVAYIISLRRTRL